MNQSKFLYYAQEYYSEYGARTHAREFYFNLQEIVGEKNAFIYPNVLGENTGEVSFSKKFYDTLPLNLKLILHSFIYSKTELNSIKNFLKENSIDIVIIRAGYKLALVNQIRKIKNLSKLIIEVNASITEEQLKHSLLASLLNYIEVKCFKKADIISVVSPFLKEKFVKRGLDKSKILVNPNGVNPNFNNPDIKHVEELQKKYELLDNSVVLGYVGGFEKFKEIPRVINEFFQNKFDQKLVLIIIGKGEDSELIKNQIKLHSHIAKRKIIFENTWISYDKLPDYMALFDINIFPYTADHVSPLKIFEYLVTGKPTIAPEIPSLKEIFKENEEIIFVSQEKKNFCQVLTNLLTNKDVANLIAAKGKRKVLNEFTWKSNAERILKKIEDVN